MLSTVGAKLSKYWSDVIDLATALGFPIVSSLAKQQIPMHQARIYHAWSLSGIFPKYGNAVGKEKTIIANWLRRATKRGKFLRSAWV